MWKLYQWPLKTMLLRVWSSHTLHLSQLLDQNFCECCWTDGPLTRTWVMFRHQGVLETLPQGLTSNFKTKISRKIGFSLQCSVSYKVFYFVSKVFFLYLLYTCTENNIFWCRHIWKNSCFLIYLTFE